MLAQHDSGKVSRNNVRYFAHMHLYMLYVFIYGSVEDQIQGFMCGRQVLYHWVIYIHRNFILKNKIFLFLKKSHEVCLLKCLYIKQYSSKQELPFVAEAVDTLIFTCKLCPQVLITGLISASLTVLWRWECSALDTNNFHFYLKTRKSGILRELCGSGSRKSVRARGDGG